MAEYKKKKIKRSIFHKKKHSHIDNDITVESKKKSNKFENDNDSTNDIKVIKGSKIRRKRQTKIFVCIVALMLLVVIILSATLPGGLYENTVNFFATIGQGSYPTSVSGGVVLNVADNGSHYYILSDTNITAYSSSGKIIFDEMHGFSNPIISVSGTRALIFDQGGKSLYVYNLSGKINSLTTKDEIITASISEDGEFAVATHSNSYMSVVTVYDSDFEIAFTWNSAKEIVNNVLVSPDGDRLAVSSFDVVSGQYNSKVMIFDFESANALHTTDFNNSLVIKIGNTDDGISIITSNKYNYLHWYDYNTTSINVSGEINSFKNTDDGVLITVNRPNDRSDNDIILISSEGEKISEFKINHTITDIQYYDGRVYSLNDTFINIYDKNGKVLKKGNCDYGINKLFVISSDTVAAISDTEIFEINFEEGEN